jgi:hypothetical protein
MYDGGLTILKKLEPVIIAAIVTAIATVGATVGGSWISSRFSEDQLEANLIIEAVKVCNKQQAIQNIRALMAAGFLPQHSEKLEAALDGAFEKLIPPEHCLPPPPMVNPRQPARP